MTLKHKVTFDDAQSMLCHVHIFSCEYNFFFSFSFLIILGRCVRLESHYWVSLSIDE